MDKLIIAQHYKKARIEEGLTMEQLGSIAGVTKSFISDFEAGKRNVTIDMLLRLSKALKRKITDNFLNKI